PPPSSPLLFASFLLLSRRPPTSTLFPYTTLFRSRRRHPRALHLRPARRSRRALRRRHPSPRSFRPGLRPPATSLFRKTPPTPGRSEEHTSELQSRENLVCRLLLEKKKQKHISTEG